MQKKLVKITKKQAEMMRDALKKNDIVICTALIPGKTAPRILTEELIKLMRPGSIVYDLAAEQGGNSAYSDAGKTNLVEGIKIIGVKSLMNRTPTYSIKFIRQKPVQLYS